MNNVILLGGTIMLTWDKKDQAALLTVRGKDHDLNITQLREVAGALLMAANELEENK